jgi:UDP-N-acetyl-D-mannosaminuronate dehydrogenase|tara:strand:- start:357 stop:653 length:297 start_codon:yes stop_codon:yes gene_type:complete
MVPFWVSSEGRQECGIEVRGWDTLVADIKAEFGIGNDKKPLESHSFDAVIVTVGHKSFMELTLDQVKSIMNESPILINVRGIFSASEALEKGLVYHTL